MLSGAPGTYLSTPAAPAMDIKGGFRLRVELALDDWEATRVGDVRMLVQGTVDEVNFKTTLEQVPLGTLRYAAALAIATGHKSRVASIGRAIRRKGQAAAA